jgi:L-threonylcarbamoyladenylate synthase
LDTTIGRDITQAVFHLKNGDLVAIPTETVYGLAGNALNLSAVVKIFEAKQRPSFDPLIVHVASTSAIPALTRSFPEEASLLADTFWPGPLTLLLPKSSIVPDLVTSGLDSVAIRIPGHPVARELLSTLDFPLAAPSANLFGQVSPTSAAHVEQQLSGRIPYILDGGDCSVGLESTIVGFPENGQPTIYRLGGIPVEEIEKVIGKVAVQPHSSSNPLAPGMLKSHYAPRKPLRLSTTTDQVPSPNTSYLRFTTYLAGVSEHRQLILAKDGKLETAARNLFAYLRKLDADDSDLILAELLPEVGLGKAINDRLKRAAATE